jgi:hypothetical protein
MSVECIENVISLLKRQIIMEVIDACRAEPTDIASQTKFQYVLKGLQIIEENPSEDDEMLSTLKS